MLCRLGAYNHVSSHAYIYAAKMGKTVSDLVLYTYVGLYKSSRHYPTYFGGGSPIGLVIIVD